MQVNIIKCEIYTEERDVVALLTSCYVEKYLINSPLAVTRFVVSKFC